MKKYLMAVLAIWMLCLLNSCALVTLHPIFTEKDLVFDARLLGSWKTGKGIMINYTRATKDDLAELSPSMKKNADKIYMLTRKDADDPRETRYYAFLVKLGQNYFFDYYPVEVDKTGKMDEFYISHFVRMHLISRVKIVSNSSISISQFDDSYLQKLIERKNIRIQHETLGKEGNYFITASTQELQQYILKYGDVPEAYYHSDDEAYTKIP